MNPEKQRKILKVLVLSIQYAALAVILFGAYRETGLWTTMLLAILITENCLKSRILYDLKESVLWLATAVIKIAKDHKEDTNENNKKD